MPRNGSGTYSLPAGNPVVTGTTISSSGWANPTLSDIAAAITASIAVDGQTVPTANLPMGNFRHLNVANGQNTNEYATVGQIQTAGFQLLGPTAGTINTTQPISTTGALTTGSQATFTTNGTAAQVNLNVFNTNTHGNWFLDTSGNVGFFDNSRTLTRFNSDTSGNMIISGDIRANSDERLKENWKPLSEDFIERLADIKSGTYDRKDIHQRQIGVGAQSLQELIPEAVSENNGTLAVAYGQAALSACVELAKEVLRLRALLEATK